VKWNYNCTCSWPWCSRVKTNINRPFILQLPSVCFSSSTDVSMGHILLRSDLQYTRTRCAQFFSVSHESVTDVNELCGRCTYLYEGGYTGKPLCSNVTQSSVFFYVHANTPGLSPGSCCFHCQYHNMEQLRPSERYLN